MPLNLQGKTAIVTGASRKRGIGAQVAYELAKRGANVNCDFRCLFQGLSTDIDKGCHHVHFAE